MRSTTWTRPGYGMVVGIVVGALIGLFTDRFGLWIAIGIAIGAGLEAYALTRRSKAPADEGRHPDQPDQPRA